MEEAWINGLIGGGLIGIAATLLLVLNGKICGISGIFYGAFAFKANDTLWRFLFLAGLIISGSLYYQWYPWFFANTLPSNLIVTAVAGLLVGMGTKVGSGCTSGHGVCGISRLSSRSIVATLVFMIFGIVTVYISKFF